MSFAVEIAERHPQRPGEGPVYRLLNQSGSDLAEILPGKGFNCFCWQNQHQSKILDLLFGDALFGPTGKATRGGIPILFPFPNRIRGGRFTWEGRTYSMPPNDPAGNAIHGFACRSPWRVVDEGTTNDSAWLTGEFQGSVDAPEASSFWPADYLIRITYRLFENRLRIEAVVTNPDDKSLPFGLGFHPYFRIPFWAADPDCKCLVSAPADLYWELEQSLPTGRRLPVDKTRDMRTPRQAVDLTLDDVLTGLGQAENADLCLVGRIEQRNAGAALEIAASPSFRELVVFTPPHRQAICLEPYTCVTDAVNLQCQGIDAGWLVSAPGESWAGTVQMRVEKV